MTNIRPLDLLLFRGSDAFSDVIRSVEKTLGYSGSFSHAGIIVTRELLPWLTKLENDRLYIWESTCSWPYFTDGNPDVVSGKSKLGVQIRDFKKVKKVYLKNKGTAIMHCTLANNPIDTDLRGTINSLGSLYFKYGNKGYESPLGLTAAINPIVMKLYNKIPKRENSKSINPDFDGDRIFCSELVALVYQKLGLLSKDINPSSVLPCYFIERTDLFSNSYYLHNDLCYEQTVNEEKESNNIITLKIEYRLN